MAQRHLPPSLPFRFFPQFYLFFVTFYHSVFSQFKLRKIHQSLPIHRNTPAVELPVLQRPWLHGNAVPTSLRLWDLFLDFILQLMEILIAIPPRQAHANANANAQS